MKVRSKNIKTILLLAGILFTLAVDAGARESGKSVVLTGGDFSQWRDNTGQWQIAGDAFMKSDNNRLLGVSIFP